MFPIQHLEVRLKNERKKIMQLKFRTKTQKKKNLKEYICIFVTFVLMLKTAWNAHDCYSN